MRTRPHASEFSFACSSRAIRTGRQQSASRIFSSYSPQPTAYSPSPGYDALQRRLWTKWQDNKGDAYAYDATSQVVGAKYNGDSPEDGFLGIYTPAGTATWTYDPAGNRLTETQLTTNGTLTANYTVNDLNQYTQISHSPQSTVHSPSYNTRGDLTAHNGWTYAYDAFGHLISATGTSGAVHKYFYDAGGTRVGKQLYGEDPVFSFHVGFDRIEDFDTSNGDVTSYIYELGIDRPLAMISDSGDISFFHQDVFGNVVALTNEAGTIAQQYRYSVWGEPSVFDATNQQLPPNNAASPFLFTAREYDVETGLYHYRARAYSPELGRFLQFDPIDFGGRDLNCKRYVKNRSTQARDPSGNFPCPPGLTWSLTCENGCTSDYLQCMSGENVIGSLTDPGGVIVSGAVGGYLGGGPHRTPGGSPRALVRNGRPTQYARGLARGSATGAAAASLVGLLSLHARCGGELAGCLSTCCKCE